jgi:hypothetical protein
MAMCATDLTESWSALSDNTTLRSGAKVFCITGSSDFFVLSIPSPGGACCVSAELDSAASSIGWGRRLGGIFRTAIKSELTGQMG